MEEYGPNLAALANSWYASTCRRMTTSCFARAGYTSIYVREG